MPKTRAKKKTATKPKRSPREPEEMNAETPDVANEPTMNDVLDAIERQLTENCAHKDAPVLLRVADALAEHFGTSSPALEIALLKAVKDHPRLVISDRRRVNYIALVAEDPKAESAPGDINSENNSSTEIPPKTVGDHVEEAKGRAQKIPWKHDNGSSVLLLTEGHPARKAVIKNIHDRGAYALYDLVLDNGEISEVEAWRIGRDLDAMGELESMRLEIGALRRHADTGAILSQQIREMEEVEAKLAKTHSEHKKAIEAKYQQLADHNRTEPGQQDLRDLPDVGNGEVKTRAPNSPPLNVPTTAIEAKIAAGDVTTLKDVTSDQFIAAALSPTASTGKPEKLKPIMFSDLAHVVVEIQPDERGDCAVLLPALDAKAWDACYANPQTRRFNLPSEVDPEQSPGRWSGMPVKVGRKVLFLAPTRDVLILRLPSDFEMPAKQSETSEPELCGKDAAAGR